MQPEIEQWEVDSKTCQVLETLDDILYRAINLKELNKYVELLKYVRWSIATDKIYYHDRTHLWAQKIAEGKNAL